MSAAAILLVAAPVLPGLLALACLAAPVRRRMPLLMVLAPWPALFAASFALGTPPVTIGLGIVPITLALDRPGAMLLGTAALLWLAAAVYVAIERGERAESARFGVSWLLTLAGSCGVFVAADLASFFLAYALVSIPAYGLIAWDDTAPARRAGAIYMGFTVLGETVLLMAFAVLAAGAPGRSLALADVMGALPQSPWRGLALALLIAGFGMKIALVPLHVWMPLTYRAAPIAAAAVLSGAGVKAGVIGLIRFLPLGTALPVAGDALAAVGLVGAFYGVAVGVTQSHPKTVLAYSSISQMGLIAAVLGAGLAAGDTRTDLAASFYAAHHVLAKGALFLAAGVATARLARPTWPLLVPAAIVALGLGGLPLTGGGVAKLAVKAPLGEGLAATLATLAAAGSTLLMLHFLRQLAAQAARMGDAAKPARLSAPWLILALASVVLPWALYPLAGGRWAEALALAALWASLWPVLVGVALAIALSRLRANLPPVPEGDILAAADALLRPAARWREAIERAEGVLREWPAASLSLLAVALLLGATALFTR
jgi:formate hydrogenlyase subunit 3/multisubunit Na+/H+ antiporter MnhD subunit